MTQDILDPGYSLTLRPMRYPALFEQYRDAIKNTWTVEEVDFSTDLADLQRMSDAERHMIRRLVAFFATGDSIVANNLVLSLYKHINSPEARLYLSRQLYEEALHVQFYLTLLDNYIPNHHEREQAFAAVDNIPSIAEKAKFAQRWIDSIEDLRTCDTDAEKRAFLLNLICFAACIEGLFFMGAFSYVYFLRSRNLLHGLSAGTSWVFRDEGGHMNFAFSVIDIVRKESPRLFTHKLEQQVREMIAEAIEVETQFAKDLLSGSVLGLSVDDMRQFLQYSADQRLARLGYAKQYHASNPFSFMELQDVQELTNFFERRVSAYQVGIEGSVDFGEDF